MHSLTIVSNFMGWLDVAKIAVVLLVIAMAYSLAKS